MLMFSSKLNASIPVKSFTPVNSSEPLKLEASA
ncbi:MAG: hypothetical protein HRT71_08385 [Flavobacteriales bacterium]|nr:hypothetical protein [Flavobacteriales bacterium]